MWQHHLVQVRKQRLTASAALESSANIWRPVQNCKLESFVVNRMERPLHEQSSKQLSLGALLIGSLFCFVIIRPKRLAGLRNKGSLMCSMKLLPPLPFEERRVNLICIASSIPSSCWLAPELTAMSRAPFALVRFAANYTINDQKFARV